MSEQIELYNSRHTGPVIDDAIDRIANTPGTGVLTAENVGAAPAGYGLGVTAGNDLADCDAAVANGWYDCDSATLNTPTGVTAYCHGELLVISRGDDKAQIFYPTGSASPTSVLMRWRRAGTWQPWEWVNPPMASGVEYRTTERYLGKPVYVKAVNFGTLPNATGKLIEHGASDVDAIFLSSGTTSEVWSIPTTIYGGINATNGSIEVTANKVYVFVRTDYDRTSATAVIIIKYTKTTD